MLALDSPYISNFAHNNHEEPQELCLEYGSATQVYLVPIAQHEEWVGWNILVPFFSVLLLTKTKTVCYVFLTHTQVKSQGPRLYVPVYYVASQVTLPLTCMVLLTSPNIRFKYVS